MPNNKKVQFVYMMKEECEALLKDSCENVLSMEPVNYYAEKDRYYQCVFYTTEDLSEIMMQFELYEYDKKTWESAFYDIDKQLYAKILLKFGQRINVNDT